MVSSVRTSRVQPNWIGDTLWITMEDYWDIEEAQQRSKTYSDARMSDRNGLGPHVHLSGPKSYRQLQDEMVEELGREVRLGEVFIKAHTKPDGTYVDRKAEKIAGTYEKTVQERLSQLEAESFAVSDGESRPRDLTTEEYTEIFLESTEKDTRGTPYGVGSLKDCLVNGKHKQACGSSTFVALEEQLKEAQRMIEEQAAQLRRHDAETAVREAEQSKLIAAQAEQSKVIFAQKDKIDHLSVVEDFLRECDPRFENFVARKQTTTEPLLQDDPTPTPSTAAS
ncbi:PREDICTED: uncharacterized protein LOC109132986 [Camelina sativa]|uniref:Uncharacterized protein LOC109132986 n=2 Tax=Camelina sativa TaxID=90675 RepID=A0ABM1RPV9_CAMSA|nr:PREDICTED: uncharacterized protein LOC109132986 [Camelina sativa]